MHKGYNKIDFTSAALSFLVMFSLAFPSKFNALSIYLLCGFSLFYGIKRREFKWKNTFVVLSIAYFCLHAIYLLVDDNLGRTSFEIEKKLGFLLLPLFWYNLPMSDPKKKMEQALGWYSIGMSGFGLFLLGYATISSNFFDTSEPFFYHNLVSVFEGNAIYYSLLYMVSLLVLIEKNRKTPAISNLVQIGFTTLILMLLSSKIFLILLLFLTLYFISTVQKKLLTLGVLILIVSVGFLVNQQSITTRFQDVNLESFFSIQKQVTPGTYFDGFTLRKELWNISLKLIEEDRTKFLFGVGPGDAQDEIDNQLIVRNFYTGKPGKKNSGYLGYNSHNQYIQSLLETGFFGLFLLIVLFYHNLLVGWKSGNRLLVIFSLILLVSFFTESYLNRQIGIIAFVGFNSMMLFLEPYPFSFTRTIKRGLDIIISSLVILLILWWLLPLLGFFIYLDTRSFPLFVQNRVGQNYRVFKCFKLRTMVHNSEANYLPAIDGDTRITRFGAILRKYSIDELPQFINVLLGEMSVVGPRPLMVSEEEEWNKKMDGFSERLSIKPGLTGLAQANGYKGIIHHPADLTIRFRLDKLYAEKQSVWLDIKIIVRTIFYIFT